MRTSFRLLLALATVAPLAAAHAQTDWPQLQRDAARSGYSPDSVGMPTSGNAVVTWRWHPDRQTSIAGRVQPVVANGLLCVGFYDGRMFAVSTSSGTQQWVYQAGGPILHTAAMDSTKVYFGCYDGKLYAVNLSNGSLAWSYDTGRPIYTAPCLADGKLFVGNAAGTLYAINTNGSLAWTYASGRPIQTTAAYSDGKVFCGNEGLYAFCVNASTGAEIWKVRLRGQSMSTYWPVVLASESTVFYRTQPIEVFHALLAAGDTVLGGDPGYANLGDGTSSEFTTEYANIRSHLSSYPHRQSFWALNTANGSERYVAPVLYTMGEGSVPTPPVVNPSTGAMWGIVRSRYARYDSSTMVRRFGNEPAKINATTGNYTLFATEATKGTGIQGPGDESTLLSADAWGLLVSWRGQLAYIRHSPETAYHVVSSQTDEDYYNPGLPKAYDAVGWGDWSVEAGGGQGGGQCAAAIVAQDSIYWIARWGLIVRVDCP